MRPNVTFSSRCAWHIKSCCVTRAFILPWAPPARPLLKRVHVNVLAGPRRRKPLHPSRFPKRWKIKWLVLSSVSKWHTIWTHPRRRLNSSNVWLFEHFYTQQSDCQAVQCLSYLCVFDDWSCVDKHECHFKWALQTEVQQTTENCIEDKQACFNFASETCPLTENMQSRSELVGWWESQ